MAILKDAFSNPAEGLLEYEPWKEPAKEARVGEALAATDGSLKVEILRKLSEHLESARLGAEPGSQGSK